MSKKKSQKKKSAVQSAPTTPVPTEATAPTAEATESETVAPAETETATTPVTTTSPSPPPAMVITFAVAAVIIAVAVWLLRGGFVVTEERQTLNPSGIAPLTALLEMKTELPVRTVVEVLPKISAEKVEQKFMGGGSVTYTLTTPQTQHTLAVLGLYADHTNTVRVTFLNEDDRALARREYRIVTWPLIDDMPSVRIDFADSEKMVDGWTMVTYHGGASGRPNKPHQNFMFDESGEIRWYLSLRGHSQLGGEVDPGDAMRRLKNGNLFWGDVGTDRIYEMDMLGNIINEWDLQGYGFHHHIMEKDNGDFLMTADNPPTGRIEDYVLEVARDDGAIRAWDLTEVLQYGRRKTFEGLLITKPADVDWFHGNMMIDFPAEDAFLVSGRTQSAVVKMKRNGEVLWILGPHLDWGVAENGTDLRPLLLQPLDSAGAPITEQAVLDGTEPHPDFEWNWYQHSPIQMPNGNIMLFDNGDNRHFRSEELYSRAVEYTIDEDAMTVQQVWQYGKERGAAFFSRTNSGVAYHPENNNVIITSGSIVGARSRSGKVVELDYTTKQIIFEATVINHDGIHSTAAHNSVRMPIIPPNINDYPQLSIR